MSVCPSTCPPLAFATSSELRGRAESGHHLHLLDTTLHTTTTSTHIMTATPDRRKRLRDDEDDAEHVAQLTGRDEKKSRPTTDPTTDDFWCHYDSVLSTPISHTREQAKYDSDDELSSLVSEPGSPQDFSMVSDDEAMVGGDLSESPSEPCSAQQQHDQQRMRRIATPMIIPPPPSPARPRHFVTGAKQHFRQRHQPREYVNAPTSDFLDVPSPIDEDEVPTPPPCPAETAESQLSMLSVTDVDMDADDNTSLPSISVRNEDPSRLSAHASAMADDSESAVDFDSMDHSPHELIVRKQRQRSGALSGADSPVRAGPSSANSKRGFSMGFRADCEKCRLQVPGHMNHFLS